MKFNYNDGGREAAGFKGKTGDCVCRSIAIAAGLPYLEVYNYLAEHNASQRKSKRTGKKAKTAANGINTTRKWFKDYLKSLGFVWTPTMLIGQGCKVHLTDGELPDGKLIVAVSKHFTAVIDQVINDTYNPERETGRCVYGYYLLTTNKTT